MVRASRHDNSFVRQIIAASSKVGHPYYHIWAKKIKICKLRILVSQLFRVILIGLNTNLLMNTNEFEGLIADGPFFAPCWGWIWDVLNYPDTNIPYNLPE